MKLNEMRKKSTDELKKLVNDEKKLMQDKYLMFKIGKEKNTSQFKKKRKLISQLFTVIKEKEVLSE